MRSHEDREKIFETQEYSRMTAARIDEIDSYLFKNIEDADEVSKKKKVTIKEGSSDEEDKEQSDDESENGIKDMRSMETRRRSTKLDEFDMKIDKMMAELTTFKKAQVFIDEDL